MLRYSIVRAIWVFITLIIILSLNFVILKFAPEYPPVTEEQREIFYARQVADGFMTVRLERDPEIILGLRNEIIDKRDGFYYVDEGHQFRIFEPVPVSVQYFYWVRNIVLDWNWGLSTRVQPNVGVFEILASRIPVTIRLNLVALVFYIPIGFTLGIIAALKKDTAIDNAISFGVMIFISVPSFVVMTVMVMVFGFQLGWVEPSFPALDHSLSLQITGMILPVLGLSFGAIAGLARFARAELTEVLTSDFVLLARTKGLTRTQAVVRHAVRNSMVPLVPSIIFSFVGLLSGSVVIERIYAIPGTGTIFLRAITPGSVDFNMVLGTTAFYTIISLFAVLLVDLSYGVVDPRIRMGGRK